MEITKDVNRFRVEYNGHEFMIRHKEYGRFKKRTIITGLFAPFPNITNEKIGIDPDLKKHLNEEESLKYIQKFYERKDDV